MINGADETGLAARIGRVRQFTARLHPEKSVIEELADTPLLAFAGIGRPKRFFASLEAAGGNVVRKLSFADHHPYSQHDLMQILEDAQRHGAEMITTQKDWMRLPADWRAAMLPVTLEIDQAEDLLRVETVIDSTTESGMADPAGKIALRWARRLIWPVEAALVPALFLTARLLPISLASAIGWAVRRDRLYTVEDRARRKRMLAMPDLSPADQRRATGMAQFRAIANFPTFTEWFATADHLRRQHLRGSWRRHPDWRPYRQLEPGPMRRWNAVTRWRPSTPLNNQLLAGLERRQANRRRHLLQGREAALGMVSARKGQHASLLTSSFAKAWPCRSSASGADLNQPQLAIRKKVPLMYMRTDIAGSRFR